MKFRLQFSEYQGSITAGGDALPRFARPALSIRLRMALGRTASASSAVAAANVLHHCEAAYAPNSVGALAKAAAIIRIGFMPYDVAGETTPALSDVLQTFPAEHSADAKVAS